MFNKKHTVLPLINITNVYLERSVLEQLLGLCSMQIDTGGGPRIELAAKELEYSEAQKFVKILREYLEKEKIRTREG